MLRMNILILEFTPGVHTLLNDIFCSLIYCSAGPGVTDDICLGRGFLTLCCWPIYIWEREGEEEVGSGDPTSLPWPI